ncbi:MAG: (2Fe-2S)-binding protein [Burkholderiales bacterium]
MSESDLRIRDGVARGAPVRFRFDDRDVDACAGESVAAALWSAGIRAWPAADDAGPPARAVFCAMGVCQQCAVWIDGVRVEACRTPVRAGLVVRTRPAGLAQSGRST